MTRRLDVMGTAEVADRLGVHKTAVSRFIKEGRLVPDAVLRSGPVFRTTTVERFAKERPTT